ncbi:MAG: hypothetical protein VYD05_02690 [Planctomycetota bacterium]|nr:hypothetical protein [Planctomycetota bacterium]
MPLSTDVTMSRDVEAVFPPLCVGCLSDRPGLVAYHGSRFTWGRVFFAWLWLLRKRVRCEVPICDGCRHAVHRRKWVELLLLVGVASGVVAMIFPWVQSLDLGRQWSRLIVLAAVLLGWLPYIVWSVFRPPLFDLTVRAELVEYEFASEEYARRFVEANEAQVVDVG